MKQSIRNFLRYLAGHGPVVLGALLLMVIAIWAFILITDAVSHGETGKAERFDRRVIGYLRHHPGPELVQDAMSDLTELGSPPVLLLAVGMVGGFLLIERRYRLLIGLALTVVGGTILTVFMKETIDRTSPGGGPTPSFPSGHSMMSAVIYLSIATVLAQARTRRVTQFYCIVAGTTLTFIVGFTRVFLRIHWPTDVIAGWAAGLAWALLCWIVMEKMRRRAGKEALLAAYGADLTDPAYDYKASRR